MVSISSRWNKHPLGLASSRTQDVHSPTNRPLCIPRVFFTVTSFIVLFLLLYDSRFHLNDEVPPTVAIISPNNTNDTKNTNNDRYAQTPFCDTSGICGENPTIPSPRTIYSARTHQEYVLWWKLHALRNQTASDYADRHRQQNPGDDPEDTVSMDQPSTLPLPPLVFLGDSITESWIGTGMGRPKHRARGVPSVLTESFAQTYDPLVLGISGDQTQHLLYRLMNGELLPEYANDERSVYVLLIGTNNMGSGELPGPTAEGILVVAEYVLRSTRGRLLLMELLPRGDGETLEALCPPRCRDGGKKPFVSFGPAVEKVNRAVRDGAVELMERYGYGRLSVVVGCGSRFVGNGSSSALGGGGGEVDVELMPDRLHPNADGHRILAKCILDCIEGSCGV